MKYFKQLLWVVPVSLFIGCSTIDSNEKLPSKEIQLENSWYDIMRENPGMVSIVQVGEVDSTLYFYKRQIFTFEEEGLLSFSEDFAYAVILSDTIAGDSLTKLVEEDSTKIPYYVDNGTWKIVDDSLRMSFEKIGDYSYKYWISNDSLFWQKESRIFDFTLLQE